MRDEQFAWHGSSGGGQLALSGVHGERVHFHYEHSQECHREVRRNFTTRLERRLPRELFENGLGQSLDDASAAGTGFGETADVNANLASGQFGIGRPEFISMR
jgi:hypothetical protein